MRAAPRQSDRLADCLRGRRTGRDDCQRVAEGDVGTCRDLEDDLAIGIAHDDGGERAHLDASHEPIRGRTDHDRREPGRDIRVDPCYGIESLVNIAWTSISTSKQDAAPGRLVILTLRDLFGRFAALDGDLDPAARGNPVVYNHDVNTAMWDALDSLAEVCAESMQSHNLAEVVRSLAAVCSRLDEADQRHVAEAAMRIVSGLGDHVLTKSLDSAMVELADVLEHHHHGEAKRVRVARDELASTIGVLNSRATRVPGR